MIYEHRVINPVRVAWSWFMEQQIYDIHGITRAVKANGGSGNIPKVVVYDE